MRLLIFLLTIADGCDRHTERGQEELPHVRGQGQQPRVPGCDGTGMTERSYPTSEVRGCNQEELPHAPTPEARGGSREEVPHASTHEARGGGQGKLPHAPTSQARGGSWEELPHTRGQGWRLGGATLHPRPGAAAGRTNPTSKERWLHGRRRA